MNARTDVEIARELTVDLEARIAQRFQMTIAEARSKIARSISASPGSLNNLRRARVKSVSSRLMSSIRGALVAELQNEVARLQHEITVHLQTGTDPHCDALNEAKAHIEAAKKILGGK